MNKPIALTAIAALLALAAPTFAQDADDDGNPRAVIRTSMGDITVELFPEQAPVTVKNFIDYARSDFYAGTIFHRVISHFMIQGGGLTEDLQPKPTGEPIVNEAANGLSNTRGTIAMARTNHPHSATSQFFINVQDNLNLNRTPASPGYTVFGRVVDGIDVVDEIRFLETHVVPPYSDVPRTPVVITGVDIVE